MAALVNVSTKPLAWAKGCCRPLHPSNADSEWVHVRRWQTLRSSQKRVNITREVRATKLDATAARRELPAESSRHFGQCRPSGAHFDREQHSGDFYVRDSHTAHREASGWVRRRRASRKYEALIDGTRKKKAREKKTSNVGVCTKLEKHTQYVFAHSCEWKEARQLLLRTERSSWRRNKPLLYAYRPTPYMLACQR